MREYLENLRKYGQFRADINKFSNEILIHKKGRTFFLQRKVNSHLVCFIPMTNTDFLLLLLVSEDQPFSSLLAPAGQIQIALYLVPVGEWRLYGLLYLRNN